MDGHTEQPPGACHKKLKALGRHWARGGQGDSYRKAAEAWGIETEADSHEPELWREHIEAMQVFTQCETQWRVIAGMGGVVYQGLDYAAVSAVMDMRGIESRGECLSQIQSLESGALAVLNSK